MTYDSFLRFIFPDGLFDYFELKEFNELPDRVEIHFEELNTVPAEYINDKLSIQDVSISVLILDIISFENCFIIYNYSH